jgi:NSS family neurotransmitter:Na+ symporter
MHPRLRWLGYGLVFVQTMILAYYLVVTGWVLAYFLAFAGGAPMTFGEFTGSYVPLLFFLLAGGLCFLVVQSGVRRPASQGSRIRWCGRQPSGRHSSRSGSAPASC